MIDWKAGVDAFTAARDILKTLANVADAAERTKIINDLQAQLMAANEAYLSLRDHYRDMEKELMDLKDWNIKAERYELHRLPPDTLVYRLKDDAQPQQPSHYACTRCFDDKEISTLQRKPEIICGQTHFVCYKCGNSFPTGTYQAPQSVVRDDFFPSSNW